MTVDPIEQFHITKLFTIGHIGRAGNRVYEFVGLHVRFGSGHFAVDDRWLRPAAACSGPHSIFGRTELRIRRRHDQKHRWPGRHEVLPAGILAVHLYYGLERDRDHSLRIYDLKPSHCHGGDGAAGVLHHTFLRPPQKRPEILQAVRAVGCPDLHSAAGGADRNHFVFFREDQFRIRYDFSPICSQVTSR